MTMTRAAFGALTLLAAAGCGLVSGPQEETTFTEISGTLIDGVEVECRDIEPEDCEQAVSAIVNGVPHGEGVEAIQIGPLEERVAVTPIPPWAASARAVMVDGFVYELVIIQEVRPGPMEVRFAPET
jgi:hypothetical protein